MATNESPAQPCPGEISQTLRTAAEQLSALNARVDAFGAAGELGQILEAERLVKILQQTINQAACATSRLAHDQLAAADLPTL